MAFRRSSPPPVVALAFSVGLTTISAVAMSVPSQAADVPLGVPDHVAVAVADIDEATDELAAATGMQFAATQTSTVEVALAGGETRQVTLRRAMTVRGGPFVELVEATPAIGPWATGGTVALSYAVEDTGGAALAHLESAGLQPIVTADDFVYLRGQGGVLVRLVDPALMPSTSGTPNVPQAAIDLGAPMSVSLSPCAPTAVKQQLAAALGITWRLPLLIPFTWLWAQGGLSLLLTSVTLSQAGAAPSVVIETPHHVPPPAGCDPVTTPVHLAFLANSIPAAERQLTSAGLEFVGHVPLVVTYFRTDSDIFVEVATSLFGVLA